MRVLLIDDELKALDQMGERLAEKGHRVQLLAHPTLAVATAKDFKPDLILVDETMRLMSGREVVISLHAFRATVDTPVVVLSSPNASFQDELRWIQLGAADLFRVPVADEQLDRLPALLEERNSSDTLLGAGPFERQRTLLLNYLKRQDKSGVLQVDPDTPFGGKAGFVNGALQWARLGPVEGLPALDEMLSLERGQWFWVEGAAEPVVAANVASAEYKPKVLVVEDEDSLRKLSSKQLERVGFTVVAAADGEEGVRAALETTFDVVVADLNMPILDGWGMIRALKSDLRTRELPILVLSAHDDYRETLKAARAGAREYMKKTGHAELLIQKVRALASPRVKVFDQFRSRKKIDRLEVGIVGPQWVLETLTALDCTGALVLSDFWAKYRVEVDRGRLVRATIDAGENHAEGAMALAAMIASKGPVGSFEPVEKAVAGLEPSPELPFLSDMLSTARSNVAAMESTQLKRGLKNGRFSIDEALAQLFFEVGSERDVRVLVALKECQGSLADLKDDLALEPTVIEDAVLELLSRQVIKFEE